MEYSEGRSLRPAIDQKPATDIPSRAADRGAAWDRMQRKGCLRMRKELYLAVGLALLQTLTPAISVAQSSLEVTPAGQVGVGTPTPTAPLEVERSDGSARILVDENSPTVEDRTLFELENNGRPHFRLLDSNTGAIWDFLSSGTFFISRIGSGATEFQLTAQGDLIISGNLTTTSPPGTFPDYVFAPSYSLMSLGDLEDYIEKERHLPGIPSAEDVRREGKINMTDLQLRLLEKIEQLTLYTLEQHQQIQALESRVGDEDKTLCALDALRPGRLPGPLPGQ